MQLAKKWMQNSLIIFIIILVIIVNITFLHASAYRVGAFLGKSALITIFFAFATLFIPNRFSIYSLLSSSSFILLIPLLLSLLFTYETYQLDKSGSELIETVNGVKNNFSNKYAARTQEINSLYEDVLIQLMQKLTTNSISNKEGRVQIVELLKKYQLLIEQRRALYEESRAFLISQLKQSEITDKNFWEGFQNSSDKLKIIFDNIERFDLLYIDSTQKLISFIEGNDANFLIKDNAIIFNELRLETIYQELLETISKNQKNLSYSLEQSSKPISQ